jgi:hypothetical protein
MQECVEELQNEMVHLESVMFLSQQDASTEKKKLDSWFVLTTFIFALFNWKFIKLI